MMTRLDDTLRHASFALVAVVLLTAPWLFGAWEMWWFWPFAGLLFAAAGLFGIRLMLCARLGTVRIEPARPIRGLILLWLPFLIYALIRAIQADVRMNAERSFLLWLTPFLVAVLILSFSTGQRRMLGFWIAGNMILLGAYGIVNHHLAGNARVLWLPGYPQYQEGYFRATGSFFCPDHFSGLMEIGLAVAFGMLLTADRSGIRRAAAVILLVVALWGIVLSKSRGGGITAVAVIVCVLWMGPLRWPVRRVWMFRCAGLTAVAACIALVALAGGHYMKRFNEYPWDAIEYSDRYQMSAAALRAWRTAPLFGIGPGMHQNLWPHFAPTPDGNREKGIWPRFPNNTYHSYEAHDDWAQLLEEYGLAGVLLFLFAAGAAVRILLRGLPDRPSGNAAPTPEADKPDGADPIAWVVAALLAAAAMTVHSFGDFVLQIPANTWVLGAIAGLGLAAAAQRSGRNGKFRSGSRVREGGA